MICTYLGYKADEWLHTGPWLVLVGASVGFALSLYVLFRRALSGDGRG